MSVTGIIMSQQSHLDKGRTVYTSAYLTSDADLSMHSATYGTDNTSAMQSILDDGGDASSHLTIIVDGKYSASQLKVKGHTTILSMPSCGFIQRPSIDLPFLVNYNRTTGTPTDTNINIVGGIWNGSGHQSNALQNRVYYGSEGWQTVMRFTGVTDLKIRNVRVRNSRSFLVYITNCQRVYARDITLEHSPTIPYITADLSYRYIHDGFKIGALCSDVLVKDVRGYSVDDVLSICPNDGFEPTMGAMSDWLQVYDPWAIYGDCSRITVDGLEFASNYHGIRLLTISHDLNDIIIRNVTGRVREFALVCDNYVPSQAYHDGSKETGFCNSLILENWNISLYPNSDSYPTSPYTTCGFDFRTIITSLVMDNITYTAHSAGYPMVRSRGTITTFYANDFTVAETGTPSSAINETGGTITNKTGNVWP